MVYNYFRYYDPSTGRYVTSDPIGLISGTNTNGYANQNPLSFLDSSGLITEVLVWRKGGGKDVGHSAIRVNGSVYGFYPTDTNGNGVYDMAELMNSKGDLHIDSLADFNKSYAGDVIDVFELDVTAAQEAALANYFNNLIPDNYSLDRNQCTTVAMDALEETDIMTIRLLPFILSPNQFREQLQHRKNQMHLKIDSLGIDWNFSTINSINTKTVPFF